jgi:hypothetical protein
MLDKFDYGLKRAFSEITPGIATPIIVSIFISAGLIPSYVIWFFYLLSIVDMLVLIQKMSYWATSYMVGWLVGVIILATTGLLTILEVLIYLIPIGFLVYILYKWIHEYIH